jgi:uncharacterized protein YegL
MTNNLELEDIGDVPESRNFHQLGIFLLDGSGSMATTGDNNMTLAENVNRSFRDFLSFFKTSTQMNNFSIAVITFDNNASVHTPISELTKIDDFTDFNPMNGHGGGTFIGGALVEAEKLATQFLSSPEASSIPHDVRIIIMSDGLCLAPDKTKQIADELKKCNKIMVCTTLFTDRNKISDGDKETYEAKNILQDLASAINLSKVSYKENDLRQFFISSMSAKRRIEENKTGKVSSILCPICNTYHLDI